MNLKNSNELERSIKDLEEEIRTQENDLQKLRTQYINLTGHTLPHNLSDYSWKWTIFMVLGFAFISSMVYLLGIKKSGSDLDTGIPAIFFQTDFAYFAILTFYIIFMLLSVQPEKFGSYQAISLFLGFWCAHWLIYDWSWWAIEAGFGLIGEPIAFWQSEFGFDALIPNPPMWLFLTEALLGGIMSLYTFTIPDNYKKLTPPAIWLFAIYGNAILGSSIGFPTIMIYITAIIFVILAFGTAGIFIFQRVKKGLPDWMTNRKILKEKLKKSNWSIDPLSPPGIFIIIGMLILMHLFLILIPVVGLFLGMIPWFFVPFFFILFNSSNAKKYSKRIQTLIDAILVVFIIILWVFFILIS